jgi:cytochrome P450
MTSCAYGDHAASWVLTLLGSHPSWLAATVTELEDLIHSHAVQGSGTSIHSQLASVPLEAWETATPVTDKVIRETLRLAQPHVAMRRNMGPELTLPGGTTVPTGAFVVYPFADVHLDPTIYPDPWLFDPSRPEPKGVELGYIGWGGGELVDYCSDELPLTPPVFFREDGLRWPASRTAHAQDTRGFVHTEL